MAVSRSKYHWYVSGSSPVAMTVKLALLPTAMMRSDGCWVIWGVAAWAEAQVPNVVQRAAKSDKPPNHESVVRDSNGETPRFMSSEERHAAQDSCAALRQPDPVKAIRSRPG